MIRWQNGWQAVADGDRATLHAGLSWVLAYFPHPDLSGQSVEVVGHRGYDEVLLRVGSEAFVRGSFAWEGSDWEEPDGTWGHADSPLRPQWERLADTEEVNVSLASDEPAAFVVVTQPVAAPPPQPPAEREPDGDIPF